jgi:hypothetical protein
MQNAGRDSKPGVGARNITPQCRTCGASIAQEYPGGCDRRPVACPLVNGYGRKYREESPPNAQLLRDRAIEDAKTWDRQLLARRFLRDVYGQDSPWI